MLNDPRAMAMAFMGNGKCSVISKLRYISAFNFPSRISTALAAMSAEIPAPLYIKKVYILTCIFVPIPVSRDSCADLYVYLLDIYLPVYLCHIYICVYTHTYLYAHIYMCIYIYILYTYTYASNFLYTFENHYAYMHIDEYIRMLYRYIYTSV